MLSQKNKYPENQVQNIIPDRQFEQPVIINTRYKYVIPEKQVQNIIPDRQFEQPVIINTRYKYVIPEKQVQKRSNWYTLSILLNE